MRHTQIALTLVLSVAAMRANSFDAWGYRSGMTEAEASAVAKEYGLEVHPSSFGATHRFHSVMFQSPDSAHASLFYIASFCDDRLTWISHSYQADMGTLFAVMSDLSASYGTPTVNTKSSMADDGPIRSLDISYRPRSDDLVKIAVNLAFHSDTNFGIQVIHEVANTNCK